MTELTVKSGMKEIVARLEEAAPIAKAPVVCAERGLEGQAPRIAVEKLLHEAITLRGAVGLIGRRNCESAS